MLENIFRPKLQKYAVDPVVELLIRFQYTRKPLLWTVLAGFFGLLVCVFLALQMPYIAVVSLLLSGYFDILDGSLARTLKRESKFGALLDIVTDRWVEGLTILGLLLYYHDHFASLFMLMLFSSYLCVTTFLVVAIFTEQSGDKSFYYSPGLMERAEAFIFFIAIILLPKLAAFLAVIYSILVFYTALKRIYDFKCMNF